MAGRSVKRTLTHLALGLASLMWVACGDDSGGESGNENGAEPSSEGGEIDPCELVTEEDVASINSALIGEPAVDSCDYVDEEADIILIVQHFPALSIDSWADVTAGDEEPVDGIEGALVSDAMTENKRTVLVALEAPAGIVQILVQVRTRVEDDALEIALKVAKVAAPRL